MVFPLVLNPQLHIPCISSPNHHHLFTAHAHTNAACSAAISMLCHLHLVSCGLAQSCCVSVGLMWSFGTIIKPRMNMFDCRRQIKGICRCCNWFTAAVIRCGGIGLFSSFSHAVSHQLMAEIGIVSVKGKKLAYRYQLKMTYSVYH